MANNTFARQTNPLMISQPDQVFSGFLSGYQTSILLNSRRLYIKIQIPSKQIIYESTIEYNPQDIVFVQVKKVFKNLPLLFQYINEYSEDIQRIRIDLKELRIKVVKNQGPRRMKNAPILYIPLKKIFVYEKKQQTRLQINIETAIKHNEILQFRFEHQKIQRKKIMNDYNQLKDQIYNLIKTNNIELSHLQDFSDKNDDQLFNKKRGIQHSRNRNSYEDGDVKGDLKKILAESEERYENQGQESLFFEDESIQKPIPRLLDQIKNQPNKLSKNIEHFPLQEKSFTYDPFSYL